MTTVRACAKTILAGEHAVIRGGPALVVPVYKCELAVSFTPQHDCQTIFDGDIPKNAREFFENVLDRALTQVQKTRADLAGQLRFRSSIPIGGGMGSSAALCVSVARIFQSLGWLKSDQLFEFSRSLEDSFHGTSSGVDVAACLENAPIRFQKNKLTDGAFGGVQWRALEVGWLPSLFISFCGVSGKTSECVEHVRSQWRENAQKAEHVDQLMHAAVEKIEAALKAPYSPQELNNLADGIQLGRDCFTRWDLITEPLREHMAWLVDVGARAIKPTGSGGGGYVLSLWEPAALDRLGDQAKQRLIPVPLTPFT